MVEENVASLGLDIFETLKRDVRHLDKVSIGLSRQVFNFLAFFLWKLGELLQIALRQHDHKWLGLEQRLDGLEQGNLLVNSVPAGLRDIKQEKDSSVQVSKGSNGLHLDSVALVEWVI